MKKALSVLLVFLLFLVGCDGTEKKIEMKTYDYSCNAEVSANGECFNARFIIGQKGDMTAFVTTEGLLSGMTVRWSGDKIKLSYGDVEKELDNRYLPYCNYASITREILLCIGEYITVNKINEEYKYYGKISKGDYEATVRPDGFLTEIYFPSCLMRISFSDFTYI